MDWLINGRFMQEFRLVGGAGANLVLGCIICSIVESEKNNAYKYLRADCVIREKTSWFLIL